MNYCNGSFIQSQCAATSIGTANQLFFTLLQTLSIAKCNISPAKIWPRDFGKMALKAGILIDFNT